MNRTAARGQHPGEPQQEGDGCCDAPQHPVEVGVDLLQRGNPQPAAQPPCQEQQSGLAGERQA
jgi:hypothetical protein